MDPNFKKILEQTYINDTKTSQLKEIKEYLKLNINYSKIKQILNLIYGNSLKEIHYNNKIYFNVNCSKEPIKKINNIIFWELYNNYQIETNYNNINEYFNLNGNYKDYKHLKKLKKTIKNISNDIIYFCLCSGIPINTIPQILLYTSTKANLKNINNIYNTKKKEFKQLNNICSFCGGFNSLELHHIKPQSQAIYLKYNLNNWLILCSDCHKKLHNNKREF